MGEIETFLRRSYSDTRRRLNTVPPAPEPVVVKYICACCERESLDLPLRFTGRPSVRQIVKAVSEREGITIEDILSERRNSAIVRARHISMYLARHFTRLSTTQIGRHIGGRDHTTVVHGVSKISTERANNEQFRSHLKDYETTFGGMP